MATVLAGSAVGAGEREGEGDEGGPPPGEAATVSRSGGADGRPQRRHFSVGICVNPHFGQVTQSMFYSV